jgi:phage shock protein PspC (stress-responsive transcriptional regulator)
MNTTTDYAQHEDSAPAGSAPGAEPRGALLRRPANGRMIAGVAAGFGRYLGVDPVLVRLGFVVLVLVGGAGLPLYLAGWLLIPDETSGLSLAAELFGSGSARTN